MRLWGRSTTAIAPAVELAQREGVADRFELAGGVPPEQLLEAIALADVGLALIQPVCLSYRMSLPNKLFEYVAAGVPVLGSDLPAIGPLISEHGIGLLAQPDQVTDVAAKLGEMLRAGPQQALPAGRARSGHGAALGPRGPIARRQLRRSRGFGGAPAAR